MRRWFFLSVLLLAVGLWIACLFVRADLYLFQHGARFYRDDGWVKRCYITSPRSLWVSVDFNHVRINYEAREKGSVVQERARFVTSYPGYSHAAVPYVESRAEPGPDNVQIFFDGQGHQLGPPHKVGPLPPDQQDRTLVVGIPHWLIVLLAAVIPFIQWRRWREERRRGFAVQS